MTSQSGRFVHRGDQRGRTASACCPQRAIDRGAGAGDDREMTGLAVAVDRGQHRAEARRLDGLDIGEVEDDRLGFDGADGLPEIGCRFRVECPDHMNDGRAIGPFYEDRTTNRRDHERIVSRLPPATAGAKVPTSGPFGSLAIWWTVFFRQYQLACLSLFSYLIGDTSSGRAVVVDPQRDVSQYLEDAAAQGIRIERVIETHFHADFVSGHLELADTTGAIISYGEGAEADYPIELLHDGQILSLGDVTLEVRATPGHTPESVSVVVSETAGAEPWGVLTGDTLFIGDVGRPDLLAAAGLTPEELARRLYQSLHGKLLSLPDATRVFPAHGAGSACGRHMSAATQSTIGEQRTINYALQPMSEDAFVALVTEGQPVAPLYFPYVAAANHHRHSLLDEHGAPIPLELDEMKADIEGGATVIDGRAPEVFASGHVRGSINVPLDGRFAEFAGDVVRAGDPVIVATEPGRDVEARIRLGRIGFDRVLGEIADVDRLLAEHPELAATATRIAASDVVTWRSELPGLQIVDVRNPGELDAGVIDGSLNIPLPRLLDGLCELDRDAPTIVYCASGVRSSIAASLLRAQGFGRVADVLGGFSAWRAGRDIVTLAPGQS